MTDITAAIERGDLMLAEPSPFTRAADTAIILVTDGYHNASAATAPALRSNAQLLLVNGIGSLGVFEKLKPEFPKGTIEGVGFHEAHAACSLTGSSPKTVRSRTSRPSSPPTWNASPRDTSGALGPLRSPSTGASLLQNPVADAEHPLEVLRTIHSFDRCMACAVHTFDPSRRNIAKVTVL